MFPSTTGFATLSAMLILFLCAVQYSFCAGNKFRELQLFFSILLAMVLSCLFFLCVCPSDGPDSFLYTWLYCVNNLKRTADLVL